MRLLVIGASGGCGQWLVRFALGRGHEVRAFVRPTTDYVPPTGTEVMRDSVLDADALDRAVQGCDAVVSSLGIKRANKRNPWSKVVSPHNLTTAVTKHLVNILPRYGIGRIVVISAAGVGKSAAQTHPTITWMIQRSNMRVAYADLEQMEAALASSDLDWMAVRPTTLTNEPLKDAARPVDYYGLRTRVSRAAVAAWMLDALEQSAPIQMRTPMIATHP